MVASEEDNVPFTQIYADLLTLQDLANSPSLPDASTKESEVVKWLAERVLHLLQHAPERLMAFLYRMDVAESRVKSAFNHADMPVHEALAAEIWLKLKQTAYFRKKYS
jgi:hypothetical protein